MKLVHTLSAIIPPSPSPSSPPSPRTRECLETYKQYLNCMYFHNEDNDDKICEFKYNRFIKCCQTEYEE